MLVLRVMIVMDGGYDDGRVTVVLVMMVVVVGVGDDGSDGWWFW